VPEKTPRPPLVLTGLWWPVLAVAAVPILTTFSRAAEAATALLVLAAPWLLWNERHTLRHDPVWRWLGVFFALYWVPMLLALPDAVDPAKSTSQTFVALRFPLAAFTIVALTANVERLQRLYALVAVIVAFWLVAGLVDILAGLGSTSAASPGTRPHGPFGDDILRLGLYSALFLPFLLHPSAAASGARHPWLWTIGLWLAALVIFAAGTRSGWIAAALAFGIWAHHRWRAGTPAQRRHGRALWIGAVLFVGLAGLITVYQPEVRSRVTQTGLAFSGRLADLDAASSYRLPIWRAAVKMAADHPLNGVGPRGFRAAYPAYAAPGDPFLGHGRLGASHAHQLQLAIMTETGALGLVAFIFGVMVFWRGWRRIPAEHRCLAAPPALALLLAVFPFNSHLDAYASDPALLFWWLLAVYLAAWRLAVAPGYRSAAAPLMS